MVVSRAPGKIGRTPQIGDRRYLFLSSTDALDRWAARISPAWRRRVWGNETPSFEDGCCQKLERLRDVQPGRSCKQVADKIWLVSFMHYDLGYFDHETCRLESAHSPFVEKVLPMSPE
jgi:putative transposase